MATPPKNKTRINKLNKACEDSLDTCLQLFEDLNSEIPELYELMLGFAKGRDEPQYQISATQYKAIKDILELFFRFEKEKDERVKWLEKLLDESNYKDRFKDTPEIKKQKQEKIVDFSRD